MTSNESWDSLRRARQAILLNDQARTLSQSAAVVDAHHKRYLGPDFNAEHEDMIHVGDTHIQQAPHPAAAQGRSLLKNLALMGLGAGLLATGVGAPIGGYLVANALKNWKPAPAAQATDTDTWYEIRVNPPESP